MRAFLGIQTDNILENLEGVELPKNKNLIQATGHHITLFFFGDLSNSQTEELIKKLDSFEFKPFVLTADKILALPDSRNPKVYALGFSDDSDLVNLNDKLKDDLINIPFDKKFMKEKFRPHITLLRTKKLEKTLKKSEEIISKIQPFGIKVKDFGLYKSEPEKGLNRYTPLKIFKLKY